MVRQAASAGADVGEVVDVVAAERLDPDGRMAVLQLLLEDPPIDPIHPADLAVCAFVALGYEEFARQPAPAVLIDLREAASRKTAS